MKSTVLIVDDDTSFLASLRDGLADEGYTLITAEDGAEAIECLHAHTIDLVLTDVNMPRMRGIQLIREIMTLPTAIPVLVMTAYGTPPLEREVERLGGLVVINKPVDLAVLRQRIREALAEARRGSVVRGITLASFVQILAMERKTCTVKVTSRGRAGHLFFRTGWLLDAQVGDAEGDRAAAEILSWDDADIAIRDGCRRQERKIDKGIDALLLGAMQQKDEAERGDPASAAGERNGLIGGKEEHVMSLDLLLDEAKSINGYIAAGIMDFTGEVLTAHTASDKTNLAAFGAVFNDVFRGAHEASRKIGLDACRDMAVATPKGLVIMHCTGTDAPVHLHGIIVLQVGGNQALARMTLEKIMPKAMAAMQ